MKNKFVFTTGVICIAVAVFMVANLWMTRSEVSKELSGKDKERTLISDMKEQIPDPTDEVKALLSPKNADARRVVREASKEKVEELVEAAEDLLEELSECASDGSDCGARNEDWQDYFTVGQPPLHRSLLRALNLLEAAGEDVDKAILTKLMKVPSFQVSYAAGSMALGQADDRDDVRELLPAARELQQKARALFLEQYSQGPIPAESLVDEIVYSVQASSDTKTRIAIVERLDRLGLSADEYREVAVVACASDPELQSSLKQKAEAAGFQWTANQLCTPVDRRGVN